MIKSDNPRIKGQGHMLRGQALSKLGKRTEGLREYIKGVEMAHPGIGARELNRMIDEHPAFQQPDVTARPNPYLAESHFGKGLHLFFARLYPEAEGQFKQAAEYYSQDARYLYFLGLAQHAQGAKTKRDAAYFSFEKAARLEAENRPHIDEINASLERVQGGDRQLINHFRAKALEAGN